MILKITDFFACSVQIYMLSNLMLKMNKSRYESYVVSNIISLSVLAVLYFCVNYAITFYWAKILCSFVFFAIYGYIMFEGNLFCKIWGGLSGYFIYVLLEFSCMYLFFIYLPVDMIHVEITEGIIIARNFYNVIAYVVIIILELFMRRKESRYLKYITLLAVVLAGCQTVIMSELFQFNMDSMLGHTLILTFLVSGIIILGYFITMELFYQFIYQKKRQYELEQKQLEKKYQYNYYLLAYEQGEQIRDLRHDIRNQLQTIQYLLSSEIENEQDQAENMIIKIRDRLQNI